MALPGSGVIELRVTGSATNGGMFDPSVASAGTDYTLQDNPQVTYGDLVIGSTTTQLTSTGHPFSSVHVGNTIRITGGTGFTTGLYNVRSVSGSTATMDRSVGTAASSSGAGNLGGALDHPSTVLVSGGFVSGNIVFVQYSATPYSFGATINFATTIGTIVFQGYDTTRTLDNADANRPIFRPTANGVTMIQIANNTAHVSGIVFDNPAAKTSVFALFGGGLARVSRCKFTQITGQSISSSGGGLRVVDNEVTGNNSAAAHVACTGAGAAFVGNVVTNNSGAGAGISGNGSGSYFRDNLVANNGGTGYSHTNAAVFDHCTAYGNTGPGFLLAGDGEARYCLSYGNTTYGFQESSANVISSRLVNCAAGGNGILSTTGFRSDLLEGFVVLSSDPFTSAAGLDFSLNNNSGAGTSCRGPAVVFPGGTTTTYPDLGAVQHSDASVPLGPIGKIANIQNIGTY